MRWRSERGAISAFVIMLFFFIILIAGLVVDGGLALNARQRVTDDAEQAARLGANQIDMAHLRATGEVALDGVAARAEASGYLAALGYGGNEVTVEIVGGEVTVGVADTVDTELMSIIGWNQFDVSGEATARPAEGIVGEL